MLKRVFEKIKSFDWYFYYKCGFLQIGKFSRKTHNKLCFLCNPSHIPELDKVFRKVRYLRVVYFVFELFYIVTFIGLFYTIGFSYSSQFFLVYILNAAVFGIIMGLGNYIQDTCFLYLPLITSSMDSYITPRSISSEVYSRKDKLYDALLKTFQLERFSHVWLLLILFSFVSTYFVDKWFKVPWYLMILVIFANVAFIVLYILLMDRLYSKWHQAFYRAGKSISNSFNQGILHMGRYKETFLKNTYIGWMTFIKIFANSYMAIVVVLLYFTFKKFSTGAMDFSMFLLFISLTAYIDNKLYSIIRILPDVLNYRRDLINPLLDSMSTVIPTPLSISKKNWEDIDKVASLNFKGVEYASPGLDNILFEMSDISLDMIPGVYLVTGDSGSGKSLFMQITGNVIFPTKGEISILCSKGNRHDIHKLNYWQNRSLTRYLWISNVKIENCTPVQLFRHRLLKGQQSYYFKDLIDSTMSFSDDYIKDSRDFLSNSLQTPNAKKEQEIDDKIKKLLNLYLFETGLFRNSERRILDTSIEKLSGGQQARLLMAYFLTGPQQVLLFDEALERTTQDFDSDESFSRSRLIKFVADVVSKSDKTIFLLTQGGSGELRILKKAFSNIYLSCITIDNGKVSVKS